MKENALQRKMHLFNAQNQHIFCLNCDWFSCHVFCKMRFQEFETPYLKITRVRQTQVFKNVYEIKSKKHNRVLGTYATDALEQIMPDGHGILKIDNFYLYHAGAKLKPFVEWLLRRLDLEFVGITRLDIAYDFNEFMNRRNPENFIKAFLHNDIVKLRKSKFILGGRHEDKNYFNGISFGSKTSAVNYKLYNKSQEMRDKLEKAHIRQAWNSTKLDQTKDVWRLEFTINSNTSILANEWANIKFHSLDTLGLHILAGLFHWLFEQYFNFRYHDRKQCRKDRMKQVPLLGFPPEFHYVRPVKINPYKKDVQRSTKIFVKKLNDFHSEMRGKDDDFAGDARAVITKLISVYGLQNWAAKKGIDFEQSNYVEDFNDTQKAYL